jgi:hypothetical protein
VSLVDTWTALERDLDPRWSRARLSLTLGDESRAGRALALLGPANPGRSGRTIRFTAVRGGGASPEGVRRMLRRLDAEKIAGRLELVAHETAAPRAEPAARTLAEAWDAALAALPFDWTDLYCELELSSTDDLDRAALLASALNPLRHGEAPAYRFRCARSFGYGVSAQMARRCFERLDAEGIPARVRVLRALSDTHPSATQGPVWHLEGHTV